MYSSCQIMCCVLKLEYSEVSEKHYIILKMQNCASVRSIASIGIQFLESESQ